jgi:chemotaxis protein methyltransferase CheR
VFNQSISARDYDSFRMFLEEACGIVLGENKQYLVASRLNRLLKEMKIESVGELIEQIKKEPRSGLRERIIDAMTTNETFWFRDNHPYSLLKELILPEIGGTRPTQVRIWSAACSSGQEPYSISMVIQEFLQSRPGSLTNNIQIVGTDISPTMLDSSREATYDALALSRGLSPERKQRFFTQQGELWKVKNEIRERVSFAELNLINSYAPLGKFDVVFCRNVLIYFSAELKRDILRRISQVMNPGGYLFLGSTETIASYSDDFETVRLDGGIVYQLKAKPTEPVVPSFPGVTVRRT